MNNMLNRIAASICLIQAAFAQSSTTLVAGNGVTYVGSNSNFVDTFNGIRYAKAPTGSLRLAVPQSTSSVGATFTYAPQNTACPQLPIIPPTTTGFTASLTSSISSIVSNLPLVSAVAGPQGEDCLTLKVQRPQGATPNSGFPVLAFIYGGAFETGSYDQYDATFILNTAKNQPNEVINGQTTSQNIVYVSMNYRLNGFGFMPGSDIKNAGLGNLGLLDQRLALQWIQDNIQFFGGDPTKVTIFGNSAGSISVFDQMALFNGNNTYKGKPLFRGAILDSGSITPAQPIDSAKPQNIYNTIVSRSGCSSATDKIACLRSVSYQTFLNAVQSIPSAFSYSSIALAFLPRPDSRTLTASPEVLAQNGQFAAVPMLIGDQEDEGTLFSLTQSNTTTPAQLTTYLQNFFFNTSAPATVQGLVNQYPEGDPLFGSPFRTGPETNIYPEYKRLAAILGDIAFTLDRRLFLNYTLTRSPSIPVWSYLSTYLYGTSFLGTFHSTDNNINFGNTVLPFLSNYVQKYYVSFVVFQNPNTGRSGDNTNAVNWPGYTLSTPNLLNLTTDTGNINTIQDTFRSGPYNYLAQNVNNLRLN